MRRGPAAVKRLRRVLYATDFSPASRPALALAMRLARHDGARLLVVHVLTPPSPFAANGGPAPSSYLELLHRTRRAARHELAAWLARVRGAGLRAQARRVEGNPSEQIVRLAGRWHADLIVIGTHGRTGVRRFMMGSVAERVVQRSPRPVLTVRGR